VHRRAAAGGVDPIATASQLVTVSIHLTAAAQQATEHGHDVAAQMLHQQSALVRRAAADILRGFQPPAEQQASYLQVFANTLYLLVVSLLSADAMAEVPAAVEETIAVHRRAAAGGVDPIATASQLVTVSIHLTAHGFHDAAAEAKRAAASFTQG
jgi:hypothetical protein